MTRWAFLLLTLGACARTPPPVEAAASWAPFEDGRVRLELPCVPGETQHDASQLGTPDWHERITGNVVWWCGGTAPAGVARFDFARSPVDESGLDPVLALYVPFLLAHLESPDGSMRFRVLSDSSEPVGQVPGRAYVVELLSTQGGFEQGQWVRVRGFAVGRSVWVVLAASRAGQRFDPGAERVLSSVRVDGR